MQATSNLTPVIMFQHQMLRNAMEQELMTALVETQEKVTCLVGHSNVLMKEMSQNLIPENKMQSTLYELDACSIEMGMLYRKYEEILNVLKVFLDSRNEQIMPANRDRNQQNQPQRILVLQNTGAKSIIHRNIKG